MNRTQARAQASQEAAIARKLRLMADTAWVRGQRGIAEGLYAEARAHDRVCDDYCAVAAGTRKVLEVAPTRDLGSRVAPDDF